VRLVLLAVLAAALSGCASSGPTATGAGEATPSLTSATATATSSPEPSCSAAGLTGELPSQQGLPPIVASLRQDIAEAARACDYGRLEELALAGGTEFTASFGGADPPGEFWRSQEQTGHDPLRMLVEVLQLPYATTEVDTLRYVWPAAYARPTWQDVTAEERRMLSRIYDEQDLAAFEQFGAYAGYRTSITADGDWQAFVAGD
jgi:hypothetical protein